MMQAAKTETHYRELPTLDEVLCATPEPSLLDRVLDAPQQGPSVEWRPFTVLALPPVMTVVRGQFFARQRVNLDWHVFIDCFFFECSFSQSPSTAFSLLGCAFQGIKKR